MCRYGFTTYKPHYACFDCRKVFKRRLGSDLGIEDTESVNAKCPQCGGLMADMGLDFEAPKQKDVRAWDHMEQLYVVGLTFHSCGCSGPGYIPRDKEHLVAFFERMLKDYHAQLKAWRAGERPDEFGNVDDNWDGVGYWIGRIRELEEKLALVRRWS